MILTTITAIIHIEVIDITAGILVLDFKVDGMDGIIHIMVTITLMDTIDTPFIIHTMVTTDTVDPISATIT